MSNNEVLPAQVIAGAIQHMNEDHGHNLLDYARNLAGIAWAEEAEMLSLDVEGFNLLVKGASQTEQTRITFDTPLTSANQLRPVLVALANRAKQK